MKTKELIEAVKNERGSAFQNCRDCEYGTHNGEVIEKLNRLAELEDKIEQGTLIELPCKVGDTVYFIIKSGNEFVLLEDTCIGFTIADGETHIGLENIPVAVNKYYFTREEAEKRLKELQK